MSDPTSTTNPSPASPTPSPQPPPRPLPWLLPLAVVGLLIAAALVARPLLTPPSASVHKAGDDGGLHGFVLNPAAPAPDVAAMSDDGSSWRLAEQKGNVVALFFGYTHCPDVCPQTLALLTQAHANMGDAADRFKVTMVTVDPERDTADVMAKYMKTFDPSFTGLMAGAQLATIASAYGTTYTQDLPPAESTRAAQIANMDGMEGAEGAEGMAMEGGESAAADHANPPAEGAMAGQAMSAAPHGHDANMPGGFTKGTPAYTVVHSGVVFLIDPQGRLRSSYLAPFDPNDVAADVKALLAGSVQTAMGR